METLTLAITIVVSAISATWTIVSKMSELQKLLTEHVVSDTKEFENIKARVVNLERFRKGRIR